MFTELVLAALPKLASIHAIKEMEQALFRENASQRNIGNLLFDIVVPMNLHQEVTIEETFGDNQADGLSGTTAFDQEAHGQLVQQLQQHWYLHCRL